VFLWWGKTRSLGSEKHFTVLPYGYVVSLPALEETSDWLSDWLSGLISGSCLRYWFGKTARSKFTVTDDYSWIRPRGK